MSTQPPEPIADAAAADASIGRDLERLATLMDEVRSLVARSRTRDLAPGERAMLVRLRDEMTRLHCELVFLGSATDAEAVRAMLPPVPGGRAS